MPATMRVPTIFSAVDRISPSLRSMGRNVNMFARRVQTGIGAGNRFFSRLTPNIGGATKSLLNFASAGAIASALFAGAVFSTDKLMEYEESVASFRTIVSDLNDVEFSQYEKAVASVALKTKKSTIDVAKSFENIAGLNADFAKTSDGISAVSEASIILAKASKMELGAAAENLVGIMNQFGYEAKDANKAINILAAGQAVGASNISQSAEAYKNFGTVAKSANMTLEESQAIIQTLGKFTILGAEAGTKARGVTLQLQKAGLGYKSGIFNQVDALNQLNKKLAKLKTAKQKDALMSKVFGAENITAGKILANNMKLTKDYTTGVTNTTEAQKGAAINSNTLKTKLDELKSTWINIITTQDGTNDSLNKVKKAVGWVTDNLTDLIKWTGYVIGAVIAFKTILLAAEIAIGVYNIAIGLAAWNSATLAVSVGGGTVAMNAQKVATYGVILAQNIWSGVLKVVTAAQWLWNVAMSANPIGLIIISIAALIALVAAIIIYWDEWGSTIVRFLGPLGLVIDFAMTLYKNWEMIKKAFKSEGIIGGLKAIGRVILDVMLKPIQTFLGLLSKIPGMSKFAANGVKSIQTIRDGLGVESSDKKETLVSPSQKQQEVTNRSISESRNTVDINLSDPKGNVKSVEQKGKNKIPINITPTSGKR